VNWLKNMVNTLVSMTHHIRMAYGDSQMGQNHKDWVDPITGIGQGNGTGPQIWAAVSTILFNIRQEDGMFATIVCMISQQKMDLAGFAFVDDTNLCAIQTLEDMDNIQTKCKNQ